MVAKLHPKKFNKSRFIPFYMLKVVVKQNNITSRSQYWRWWNAFKPKWIPKFPNRTYPEWINWNNTLENDNSFGKEVSRKRKMTRPFWDAVRWVQPKKYKTRDDYRVAYEAGDIPEDMPKMPERFYPEWNGWGAFLGTNIRSIVMNKLEDLNMLALCRIKNVAGNMIEVITNPDGVAALQAQCAARHDLEPYKVYHIKEAEKQQVTDILNKVGSSQSGNVYIIANIHELVSELDFILEAYVPGRK